VTRSSSIGSALALLALVLGGCAENAVLEVELTLPAQPAAPSPPLFAYVQARSADVVSFDEAWAGTDAVEGRALEDEETALPFSIVAGGASFARELGIRIRFCRSPDCTAVGDDRAPEARYRIERAFYQGQRTRLSLPNDPAVDPLPPVPPATGAVITEIDKCDIEGCTIGTSSMYCYLNGNHFCEE
jgi:hypothetical protein